MLRFDPPVLLIVSDKLRLLPVPTFPKTRLAGFTVSWPGVTPVPERGMERVGFGALLVMVIDPVKLPGDVGAKSALRVVLCPAANVTGALSPPEPKLVPLTTACEMVRLEPPELVSVIEVDWLLPIRILPNATLEGDADNWPALKPVPDNGT